MTLLRASAFAEAFLFWARPKPKQSIFIDGVTLDPTDLGLGTAGRPTIGLRWIYTRMASQKGGAGNPLCKPGNGTPGEHLRAHRRPMETGQTSLITDL